MLKYDYEEIEAHKTEHQELIDSAKKLQRETLHVGKPMSEKDIEFMDGWLSEHILTSDMELGVYFFTRAGNPAPQKIKLQISNL